MGPSGVTSHTSRPSGELCRHDFAGVESLRREPGGLLFRSYIGYDIGHSPPASFKERERCHGHLVRTFCTPYGHRDQRASCLPAFPAGQAHIGQRSRRASCLRCTYGNACSFQHEAIECTWNYSRFSIEFQSLRDDLNRKSILRPIVDRLVGVKMQAGSLVKSPPSFSGRERHAALPPELASSPFGSTCRHFLNGKCSYGELCRFSHMT